MLLGGQRGLSPELHAEISHRLGFDRPIVIQYLSYLNGVLHGDFGASIVTKKSIIEQFLTLFPRHDRIVHLRDRRRHRGRRPGRGDRGDQARLVLRSGGHGFGAGRLFHADLLVGPLLIILFSGVLGWTPVSGRISPMYFFPTVTGFLLIDTLLSGDGGAFASAVGHLVLPSIVLATIPLAVIARANALGDAGGVVGGLYPHRPRQGLAPLRVVGLHALRNAMIPVITTIGLQIGMMMAGAILTETVFSWPGIGKWMVDSVFRRDYPVIQSGLLLIALVIMVVNLIVDLLYGSINPRIRHHT